MKLTPLSRPLELHGTGFPEGKVTAPVGAIYTDRQATNGAIRWIKTSGTGNTGWQVGYGDTGWRDLRGLLENGWTANTFSLRRVGDSVQIRIYNLDGRSATSDMVMVYPRGFGHDGIGWYIPGTSGRDFAVSGLRNLNLSPGSLLFKGGFHYLTLAATNDRWPTDLPGTPV